ncbi:MAG: hypothetical protein WC004_04135 [Candidatus Absconditabacterales bacterium]
MLSFFNTKKNELPSHPIALDQLESALMRFFHDINTAFISQTDQEKILGAVRLILKDSPDATSTGVKADLFPNIHTALLQNGVPNEIALQVLKLLYNKGVVYLEQNTNAFVELAATLQTVLPKLKSDDQRSLLLMALLKYDSPSQELEKISIKKKFPHATPGFVDTYLKYTLEGNQAAIAMLSNINFEINGLGILDICLKHIKLAVSAQDIHTNITYKELKKLEIPALYDKQFGSTQDWGNILLAIPGTTTEEKVQNFRAIFQMNDPESMDFWTNSTPGKQLCCYNINGTRDNDNNELKSYGPLLASKTSDTRISSVRFMRTLR